MCFTLIPFQRRSKNEMELLESIAFGICLFAFGDIQTQYYQCECKHENVKRTFGTSAVVEDYIRGEANPLNPLGMKKVSQVHAR